MKFKLHGVSYVIMDTMFHEFARLAVQDSVTKVDFEEVLIFTDKPELYAPLDCKPRFIHMPHATDKASWARDLWYRVPKEVKTSHMLLTQWDSSVWDPTMWNDEYLNYDYIGSPWWYKDGKNVGNSGFCLKSTRLARYIMDRRSKYPCDTGIEDSLLCREYRTSLEEVGFTWAPERLAHDFAFECCRTSKTSRHFGFHGMFNWPIVLEHEQVLERLKMAFESKYLRDSYMMDAFRKAHPQIIQELTEKCNARNFSVHGEAIP